MGAEGKSDVTAPEKNRDVNGFVNRVICRSVPNERPPQHKTSNSKKN